MGKHEAVGDRHEDAKGKCCERLHRLVRSGAAGGKVQARPWMECECKQDSKQHTAALVQREGVKEVGTQALLLPRTMAQLSQGMQNSLA